MIKNKLTLLQNIAGGLNKNSHNKICNLEAIFFRDKEIVLRISVPEALDYLANDIFWNEESDWSLATHAEIRVL